MRSGALWVVLVIGCGGGGGGDDPPGSEVTGCDGATLLANPADPAVRGPWAVGARTLSVGGLTTEVWYPAAPGSEVGLPPARYDIRQALPPAEAAKIPDDDNPWQACDCVRDLPLDAAHGPFPAVVFVHGTAAFRHQSVPLVTHWASRGFIVIAANHPGLYLADMLDRACGGSPPAQNLSRDIDALIAALGAPAGELAFLAGHVDATRLAVIGHSAGGSAAAASTAKPGVRVVVPMASPQVVAASPSLQAVLYLGGLADNIASWGQVKTAWSNAPMPRRLVGIQGGGHLTFSDLCEAKNAQGQNLLEIASEHGVCGAQLAGFLFDCDPTHIAGPKGWDIIDYATSSVLEPALQCSSDRAPARIKDNPDVAEYQEAL